MKISRMALALFCLGVLSLGYVQAQPLLMSPGVVPYTESAPVPVPPGTEPYETYYLPDMPPTQPVQPYVEGGLLELYPHVTYRDTRRIHPAAVPYIIQVPLHQPRRSCVECVPSCALVKICVPPCHEPCVGVRRDGHLLRYDFGKYSVRVVVRRNNQVIVNYGS